GSFRRRCERQTKIGTMFEPNHVAIRHDQIGSGGRPLQEHCCARVFRVVVGVSGACRSGPSAGDMPKEKEPNLRSKRPSRRTMSAALGSVALIAAIVAGLRPASAFSDDIHERVT